MHARGRSFDVVTIAIGAVLVACLSACLWFAGALIFSSPTHQTYEDCPYDPTDSTGWQWDPMSEQCVLGSYPRPNVQHIYVGT
jgi:hypothetical protein